MVEMTVTELIEELQQVREPDSTLVVLDESEVDEPCEFVSLRDVLGRR